MRERNTPRKPCDGCKKDETIVFRINPEAFRCITYVLFWIMSFTAILLTKFYMSALLLAGPGDVTNSCPPYTVTNFPGSEPVDRTKGFDIYTESHLYQILGFNNVCRKSQTSKSIRYCIDVLFVLTHANYPSFFPVH